MIRSLFIFALLCCILGNSSPLNAQTGIEKLSRDGYCMADSLKKIILLPNGIEPRTATDFPLSVLTRDLLPDDVVYCVEPMVVSVSMNMPKGLNIEHYLEVLRTPGGKLLAVPVPVIKAATRAPEFCCDGKREGRCFSDRPDICFEIISIDRCTLSKMDVPNTELCINPKNRSAQNINFHCSYEMTYEGQPVKIIFSGHLRSKPGKRQNWPSAYVINTGCFLLGTGESSIEIQRSVRQYINDIFSNQKYHGLFKYGVKGINIK